MSRGQNALSPVTNVRNTYIEILYRKWVPDESPENPILQFVVPNKIENEILIQLYNHKISGYLGVKILLAWV